MPDGGPHFLTTYICGIYRVRSAPAAFIQPYRPTVVTRPHTGKPLNLFVSPSMSFDTPDLFLAVPSHRLLFRIYLRHPMKETFDGRRKYRSAA